MEGTHVVRAQHWMKSRLAGDLLLFSVTVVELTILVVETRTFTVVDWIYLSQHLIVLGVAFTRIAPEATDYSFFPSVAVVVSYTYSYAQIAILGWQRGQATWPEGGLVLVTIAAFLSLASLLSLGRSFGVRPALRRLVTWGPYRFVRHPLYLAYLLSDVGYNMQEGNGSTLAVMAAGWIALVYRIDAEEKVLSHDAGWPAYVSSVPYRVIPGLW